MTDLKKKLITAVASGAILLNALTPLALADTTIEISGNGSSSDNTAKVTTSSNTTVVQNNDASVSNKVDANASTGGNRANDNTGGDVVIDTGKATTKVDVSTTVNKNIADVERCNCNSDADVLISGNGSKSDNDAELKTTSDVSVFQTNKADVTNDVNANAKTGDNQANRNTGTGSDVVVLTGEAQTNVDVATHANANIAKVGGSNHGSAAEDLRIIGNGANSDNDIYFSSKQSVVLVQDNDAYVYNDISAKAKTGGNRANDNTGGDVTIDTGKAKTWVGVDNLVNFNAADVDCGCVTDVLAKISGNGYNSDNEIKAKIDKDLSDFQTNAADLYNDVYAKAKTGNNDAKRNTGPVSGDATEIFTGESTSWTDVNNTGNANIFGPHIDWHIPEGVDLNLHSDLLSALLSLFHFRLG